MISMNAIGSAGGAASYYTQEQAAIEYYADEAVPSQWHGQGAEINGLTGAVKAEDLTRVLEGKVKEVTKDAQGQEQTTEKQLGRTVTDKETGEVKNEHRAGWDMTFSAPKSVSIEAEVFGNKDVRQAHEAAVVETMKWLEKEGAMTRVNGRRVETGNLTFATFGHATSREGDPQTHTHVLVANVTYVDGKAYSLSNERLMQLRTTADAVYKNSLAERLQEQGQALEYDGRGNFELKAYDKDARDQFSKRSEQIKEALAEYGHTPENASYEARQAATLATRQDKGENHSESAEVHRDRWQAEALGAGIERGKTVDPKELKSSVTAAQIIDSATASVADREQVFQKKDLVKEAMHQSSGRVPTAELLKEIEHRAESGALIQREQDKAGARYTTSQAIAGELWADKQISAGREGHTHVMTEKEFSQAVHLFNGRKTEQLVVQAIEKGEQPKYFNLSAEQVEAARSILTGKDQFQAVQGYAGTGKTTMLEFIREAAESKGWTVQGMSTGAAQAGKMEAESGIKSTTTASFLRTNREEVGGTTKTLFIVDEASLAGQKEFNGIIGETQKSGAKTIFLGDVGQHQSVTAGAALERAIGPLDAPKMQVDVLANITRQKTDQAREPVSLIMAGNHADAIRKTAVEFSAERLALEAKWEATSEKQGGKLTQRQTDQKRDEIKEARQADNKAVISAIASDYGSLSKEQRSETAVITATNADRNAINQAIRDELKAQGELRGGKQFEVLTKKDITDAQKKQVSSYQVGDVLTKENKNGSVTQYRVEGIDTVKNKIVAIDEKGKSHTFNGDQLGALSAWASETKEFAAGDKVSFNLNSKGAGLKNGWGGTIEKIDGKTMTVTMDDGKSKTVNMDQYKQVDHGYATTSHKAQGQTINEVWVHHNTEGGMHGQRENYVNMTRARFKTVVYTQDREKAAKQASQEQNKTTATKARGVRSKTQGATVDQEQKAAAAPELATDRAEQMAQGIQNGSRRDYYARLEATPPRDQAKPPQAPQKEQEHKQAPAVREKTQSAAKEQDRGRDIGREMGMGM